MARHSRDASPDLVGDSRRRTQRKPPRHLVLHRYPASAEPQNSSSLTTFQKLDREMGKFLKSQSGLQCGPRDSCSQQISEEDSSRGVRHGMKWKPGWMFEQDSLYWETVRRQNVSGDEDRALSSCRRTAELAAVKEKSRCSSVSSESGSCEDDAALRPRCSGMELHLRSKSSTNRTSRASPPSRARKSSPGARFAIERERDACNKDAGSNTLSGRSKAGWPAVLRAKCEVLQIEKDLAEQKWRQQCAEMAQAAEMAHVLRASVQTILETAKRGTSSAPCTPGRRTEEDVCLLQRIQRLQKFGVHRDLEDQAKSFQKRIHKLQQQSQVRSADSSLRKDIDLRTHSGSPSSAHMVKTNAEEWAHVQEMVRHLRGEITNLQHCCESWEKRAGFAESKAASLQLEEEKWRLQAQTSEEKIKELEKELVQVRATMEEVRNRHALEQSRLLRSGGSHGYALVLQPFVRSNGGNGCRCSVSSDFEPCMGCGGQCNSVAEETRQSRDCGCPPYPTRAAAVVVGGETCHAPNLDPASPFRGRASSRSPSPFQDFARETGKLGGTRHRYEGSHTEWDASPNETPSKAAEQTAAPTHHETRTEAERSLSQKWFKQRAPIRSPLLEKQGNTVGSPRTIKTQATGGGLKGQSPLRKAGPSSPASFRVSSPSPVPQRTPLREIKRNTLPSKVTSQSLPKPLNP